MDNCIVKSMQKIVDYLYANEFKHYIENDKPDDHIFVHINKVEKWINLK